MLLTLIKRSLLLLLLTALTQTGGLVYVLYLVLKRKLNMGWHGFIGRLKHFGAFLLLYLLFNLILTPLIAQYFGRVPMPIYHETKIKPANASIWLANRHYVKPELKNLLLETALSLPSNQVIIYLDANFPCINGFPMTGHLSHDDGEKIDLAFIYSNSNGEYLNTGKSYSGYGIVEQPRSNEVDQPAVCEEQGHWQYSFTTKFSVDQHPDYKFDYRANRRLLQSLALHASTGKVFIEPHLKNRLELQWFNKIRFHGCHAVRHDDHIHLQL